MYEKDIFIDKPMITKQAHTLTDYIAHYTSIVR